MIRVSEVCQWQTEIMTSLQIQKTKKINDIKQGKINEKATAALAVIQT